MTRPHVVAVPVTNRPPLFEIGVTCEVFGIDRPELAQPWYRLKLCAAEPGSLHTRQGLGVQAPYDLADLVEADTVVVPGWDYASRRPPERLLAAVRRAHTRGARIVSVCSGAFVLAAAGLLDGRRATTHWMVADHLTALFPLVTVDPGVLFVDEGDVMTSAGTGAAIDMCLHLVRVDHGTGVANALARRMVVPPHRSGGQAQYARLPARAVTAPDFEAVLDWARTRLDQRLTVADMAARARMSERTFNRRFREATGFPPLRWLTEQRIRLAQELLETTDEPVEWIGRRTGFGTAANLRLHFARVLDTTPLAYRRVFRS